MNVEPATYVPIVIALGFAALFTPLAWNLIWPSWKRYGKLLFSLTLSIVLAVTIGWWSLIYILGHHLIALVFHLWWCRKHGFDWKAPDPDAYRAAQQAWFARMQEKQRLAQ